MRIASILKNPMSNTLKHIRDPSPRVKFDLPTDQANIIEYIQDENELSQDSKRHAVVRLIQSSDVEILVLQKWLTEFKDNILFFDKESEPIAFSLLRLEWYTKDKSFAATYQEFILNLVTAHPRFLQFVLLSIINVFSRLSEDKEIPTETERKALQQVHTLAKRIIGLIPMSENSFSTVLIQKFPYMKFPSNVLLHYVENLLTARSYLPEKRNLILECIIEKIIQIDVNCTKDVIESYEQEKQEEVQMDLDDNSNNSENADEMAFPLAHTLDILLNCLFTYIKDTCFPNDAVVLDWEATRKLYKELLTAFDKVILPTHASSHVQYLLFYVCSLRQDLTIGFLDYLWKKVQNPSAAPVLRQIATFYIGSFLARAKYINISTVRGCFDLMCSWIHRYIDAHTSQDPEVHGTFHSVCQTVFYVFAFRSKELLEMKDAYRYIQSLNFDRIVTCRLNPLRFCDSNVTQNFASITRNHQIAYIYPVIEKNNRNMFYSNHHQSSLSETAAGAMIPTFFPFDPYALKRSKHWIESNFRTYNHSNKDEERADHVDDEEMRVGNELFSYSMSPGFKRTIPMRHISCSPNG